MRPRNSYLLLSAMFLVSSCDPLCGNEVLSDVTSPDGRRHAVVFERNCGATTDFTTQVSILTSPRKVSGGGNIFGVDSDHGKAPSGPGGGPAVTVSWLNARTLEVHYDRRARVFTQRKRHDDTDVKYLVDGEAPNTQ